MSEIPVWKMGDCPSCKKELTLSDRKEKKCSGCGDHFTYSKRGKIGTIICLLIFVGIIGKACSPDRTATTVEERGKLPTNSNQSQPSEQTKAGEPVYIERLFSKEYERVYVLMKKNGLISDKDGADKAKLAAIVASGFGTTDNDPCFDVHNDKKCLVQLKETLSNEKYKAKLAELIPRIKPLPVATDKERSDTAVGEGTPLCEQAVIKGASIPSTVDFTWKHKLEEYTDGSFVKTGAFTHKNAYGQKLKKEYECKITLSKRGYNVVSAKIISLHEVQ